MKEIFQSRGPVLSVIGILIASILLAAVAFLVGRGCAVLPLETPSPTPPWPTRVSTSMPPPSREPTPTNTRAPTATPTFTPTPLPTPTVIPKPPLPKGYLITVSQDFQVAMPHESDKKPDWWPLPWFKTKFMLIAAGTVHAGVDLDKLRDQDVVVEGDKAVITLPPPEVFGEPTLNLDETRILKSTSFDPFDVDWNKALDAQRAAKGVMLDWALEHGLLDTARANAEQRIELLVLRLGFTSVEIKWRDR